MYFTCGVLASGTMDCWGDNNSGQLGVGGIALSETPIAVVGLP
jgi:hypothetical protein